MPATYTDRLAGLTTSVAVKSPCRVATTANITLSGLQSIDGVTVVAGDRVLVKNQTSSVQNGIYVAGAGAWTRALDFDGSRDAVGGTQLSVTDGATNADTYWRISGSGVKTIAADAITFEAALINNAGTISYTQAGSGAVARTVQDRLRDSLNVRDYYEATDSDFQSAFDDCMVQARATGKAVWVPSTSTAYTLTEKIDRTGVHIHGDGESSVITGAAGKDILYWKRPDEAGYSAPFRHITKGLRLNLNDTSDVSASYNRIGAGGERIGNCGVVFPDDNKAAVTGWEHPIFQNLNIYCSTGTNKGNRTAALFFGHPFNGLYMEDCYVHFPSYGLIQGIPGARPVVLDGNANTVAWVGHGLSNNQKVSLIYDSDEAALPSELMAPVGNQYKEFARQVFFVRGATTDTFQLSFTSGGAAIDFTGPGVGQIYAGRAGTTLGVEFAPDEWKISRTTLNTRRVCLTLANNIIFKADQLVLHPLRAAYKLLNYPSNTREGGGSMERPQWYTEGPQDADFTAEYIRNEWSNSSMNDTQVNPVSGVCTVILAGHDNDYGTMSFSSGAAIYLAGHRNEIVGYPIGAADTRIVDRGSDNKVHFQREVGGSSLQGTPDRMSYRSLNFRDGFDPTVLSRNPSSRWRGSNTLFVSGPWTSPFALSLGTQFEFRYDDDTTDLPGYVRALSGVSGSALNFNIWNGISTGVFDVGTVIPASWGTLYMRIRASGACTADLSVNQATVPLATTMSLTTAWSEWSVRYDATGVAPGTDLSAQVGARSAAESTDVDWFYFEPDTERVRSHQLALSGITFAALTNGGSTTIAANKQRLQNTTTGTIATHTVTLPAAPQDGDIVELGTDGEITGLTLSANAGQTVTGAPTTLAADASCSFFYRASTAVWYRKQ